eukprot:scaffold57140_cov27-Tisochrysis_lutea.AAC.2
MEWREKGTKMAWLLTSISIHQAPCGWPRRRCKEHRIQSYHITGPMVVVGDAALDGQSREGSHTQPRQHHNACKAYMHGEHENHWPPNNQ